MERVTCAGKYCDICSCDMRRECMRYFNGMCTECRIYERLREYEDTGHTPEEIIKLRQERDIYKAALINQHEDEEM